MGSKSIPLWISFVLRKIVALGSTVIFPYRIYGEEQSLANIEQILDQNNGMIVLLNHFSLRDAVQVFCWLFGIPAASRRRIVAPVAYHQHGLIVDIVSSLLAIDLQPIVTARTVQLGYGDKSRGAGMRDYLNAATSTLDDGDIVLLAPQGGRKNRLGEPVGHPVGMIISHASRSHVNNFGIFCVGVGLKGATNYDKKTVSGKLLFRRFEMRIGAPATVEQVVEKAGSVDQVDTWVFEQLGELVPPAYRDPLPGQARSTLLDQVDPVKREAKPQ